MTLRSGAPAGLVRMPSFCSGCPHNTSTVVPEGSIAMGGIGCHGMATWLPERRTLAVGQMGGEGAAWIGQAPFTDTPHIFQNLGDGTYFHSGLLAVRAAVTAGVNITYKILVNGAVAMTGGQPIEGEPMEGEVTTPEIVAQLRAEGVKKIVVVSDDPDRYARNAFPLDVRVRHRDQLARVQKDLREVPGASALVYDQTCAAEARRLRKRGEFPDPDRRIVINEAVCEGCGDCSVQSNCISIEPIETELGRKRTINQSSCNKDFSCVKGYCPSFVSVEGATLRKVASTPGGGVDEGAFSEAFAAMPDPGAADAAQPFSVLVAGIGGTGVITVGALLGMAAHLERKGCLLLDVTGLAQKNGPVTSHERISDDPDSLHATRIAAGAADLVLGCDIVVTAGAEGLGKMSGRTTAVVNSHVAPTAAFASSPDLDLSSKGMEDAIDAASQGGGHFVSATGLATALFGDAIASNLFLLGYAYQLGRLPVSLGALERAIELNGRSVEMNKRAVAWGRLAAHDPETVRKASRPNLREAEAAPAALSLDALVAHRVDFLSKYQSARYAKGYRTLVDRVAARESALVPGSTRLALAVARYYAKLLAYKDEYEVARLYTDGAFLAQLESEFEGSAAAGDYTIRLHIAPQVFFPKDKETGRAIKVSPGSWVLTAFSWLRRLKFLRGTPLDPFGWVEHRKIERQLIVDYASRVEELLAGLSAETLDLAVEIASLPEGIRGFFDVKEEHLEDVRAKEAELLEAFRLRAPRGGGA